MNDMETAQCNRFKAVRQSLKMKQGDFAKELVISQGHASDIENHRKNVSDRLIEIMVLKFNISEEWMRHGTGDMFIRRTRTEKITDFAADILKDEEESFRRRLIEALADLEIEEWELLEKIAEKASKKRKS